MQFNYQARTKNGLIQVGVIEVSSRNDAVSLLQKEGLYITHLEEVTKRPFYFRQIDLLNRAGKKDVMMFCRELALMLKSGVGLVESLRALAEQTEKSVFKAQIVEVSEDVEGGVYFSEALSKFPKIFSNFFINIIKAGEASGKLSESLNYLAQHLEREYNLINKIKSGMTYPAFILLVFLGIGGLGIFMVLPSFQDTLSSLEVELPVLTRAVLGLGEAARTWWWAFLIGIILIVVLIRRYSKTDEGREIIGKIVLKIPILGKTVRRVYLTRFTENLSTLILAGLPITQALDIVSGAAGNKTYQRIIMETQEGVRRGELMSSVLEKYPKDIPGLVTQMIKVGERTGRLDESLMHIANFYESEVNRNIDALIDIIEPVLIVVLGGMVALLMVSIIVPVYKGVSSFGF
ncbi:type II secretion system F family protein [Patescibacteria group bacterium]|nr:type II secretion system F family protein [Patescibacteria group bacterium]MBU4162253.1 type II secretion system F family protein [Patescibacteria group bacterium]